MKPAPGSRPITIARIAKTRGRRGEVLVELYTDFPDRFDGLRDAWLEFADGRRERFSLSTSWTNQGRRVIKFAGIDTIEAAEDLVGAWIQVEAENAVRLPEGTYYDCDLVGCVLRDSRGEILGAVTEVLHLTGNNLLVVQGLDGEFWVPASAGICREISVERREIVVDLPEGLRDLNR